MAFIGNTNTTQAFTSAIDYFSGNGSTTAFTLTRPVASVAQVQVVVNNVAQNPSSAFSVSGSTITFTSAPSAGTSNIYVYYTSPITQIIQPSQGTIGKIQLDVYGGTGTGAMTIPAGTTAQRPPAPLVGDSRWNTTLATYEIWNGSSWQVVASTAYTVDYLVVAGGAGAGTSGHGGGGGAGGFLTASAVAVSPGTAYTITVGSGGAAATSGNNSSFSTIATSVAGGAGATYPTATGTSGGSGGGGSGTNSGTNNPGGAGTGGQGYAGGAGYVSAYRAGGGGGGAGAVGQSTTTDAVAGNGGVGLASSLSGSSVYYGGGGGGAASVAGSGGTGGNGGGGAGTAGSGVGGNGTANTGGGGGGGYTGSGSGGSGIVIIRYAGSSARATGGTITITGGYVIHTFTTSGTFTA